MDELRKQLYQRTDTVPPEKNVICEEAPRIIDCKVSAWSGNVFFFQTFTKIGVNTAQRGCGNDCVKWIYRIRGCRIISNKLIFAVMQHPQSAVPSFLNASGEVKMVWQTRWLQLGTFRILNELASLQRLAATVSPILPPPPSKQFLRCFLQTEKFNTETGLEES